MLKKIYFAHPINTYETPFEGIALEVIKRRFPNHDIICPNTPAHAAEYTAHGMSYFTERLVPQCSVTIGMPYPDGKFGAGVASEIRKAFELKQDVYVLMICQSFSDLSVSLRYIPQTLAQLFLEHTQDVLDRYTTRGRTWVSPEEYGKTPLHFLKSHIVHINPEDWKHCEMPQK
ncbi:MAG: hypothetical protein COW88_03310 [Candidatus Lloydbacteria bacterium CG22_combo_CG10-13_8_21_14_all_47_15]|uniref:Uncharacterized protein n=1 Tax=Candidatus Lloydbacteria bacterium CG22_combo_CG10-13_8_21_14_all_47_15 TaxID=1974635 RepID=A0A2H0CSX6_9BACT|nr:MAG: hypothetical protein COW88_03310 [Candidatus Lloydbacteria bacterium CG22_combo_CG10-13_8_21_14_all_47_15]